MSAPTAVPPQPLLSDEQPLAQYRSIAPIALVALGLGICSALVLVSPLLAPVPVAAIIVAITALRTIRDSGGQLAGKTPAIAGLCLAIFFLSFGLTRHLARQRVLEHRACEMADLFFDLLVQGKVKEAHQFRQSPSMRITAPEAIAEHYTANSEAAKDLQSFAGSQGIKDIITLRRAADVRFEGVNSATRDGQSDMLVLRYSYIPSAAQEGERKSLWIHINRKFDDSTKRPEWEIGGVQNTPPLGSTE
jgi:hypothetical protein